MTLNDLTWVSLFPFLLAAIVSYWACGRAIGLAKRFDFVDRPDERKRHARITPLGGGLAIAAAVLGLFAVGSVALFLVQNDLLTLQWLPPSIRDHLPGAQSQLFKLWIILGTAACLSLVGFWDDVRGIRWTWRLLMQFLLAFGCLALLPDLRLTLFLPSPAGTWILTALWLVTLVNAFNLLDNMDGLSSGVALLSGLSLSGLMLFGPNPETNGPQLFVAGLAIVVSGAAGGFLLHNYPPARLFMGDAGSYFLGFLLACCTILASYTHHDDPKTHAVLAPLLVMSVPLYDLVSVILVRLSKGTSPFAADRNHFSHRLVELGFTPARAVQLIYLVTLISGLAAFLLHRLDRVGAILLVTLVGCLFLLIAILEWTARRRSGR